jgi:uncharacterized MnhB-related membrane protein
MFSKTRGRFSVISHLRESPFDESTVSVLPTEYHTSTLYQYFLQSIIQVHCISTSYRASYKYTVSVLPTEHHTSTLYQYFLQEVLIQCTCMMLCRKYWYSVLVWCSVGSTDTVYLYDALSEVLIQCTCMMLCQKYWYSVLVWCSVVSTDTVYLYDAL